ncbi:MAG: hypothetical protein HKP27_06400, partial [Myxococcales bacterium]|nr:hypothetical protein [Myxococcales bacterium]
QQVHTVDVEVPRRTLRLADASEIKQSFEKRYAELFGAGSIYERGTVAYEACRVVGTRDAAPLRFLPAAETVSRAPSPHGERRAYFESTGFVSTRVFDGSELENGARIEGPAIIERMGDSVVVPPGRVAAVDPYMSLRISGSEVAR